MTSENLPDALYGSLNLGSSNEDDRKSVFTYHVTPKIGDKWEFKYAGRQFFGGQDAKLESTVATNERHKSRLFVQIDPPKPEGGAAPDPLNMFGPALAPILDPLAHTQLLEDIRQLHNYVWVKYILCPHSYWAGWRFRSDSILQLLSMDLCSVENTDLPPVNEDDGRENAPHFISSSGIHMESGESARARFNKMNDNLFFASQNKTGKETAIGVCLGKDILHPTAEDGADANKSHFIEMSFQLIAELRGNLFFSQDPRLGVGGPRGGGGG